MEERIRDLEAVESTNLVGEDRKLRVTAEIEVGSTGDTPHLCEAVPAGFNPRILILELTIRDGGGGEVMNWKPARFERSVSERQFQSVEVRYQGSTIATATVQVVHS